jgi:hypothetical protein
LISPLISFTPPLFFFLFIIGGILFPIIYLWIRRKFPNRIKSIIHSEEYF